MEKKEIKIKVPDGYKIDKENSTFECIKFKPIKKELPKTWEEYCKNHPRKEGEAWIGEFSQIYKITTVTDTSRNYEADKVLLPNIEYAKAMLALCQLIQLRDCYNDGWVPDWNEVSCKYNIIFEHNRVRTSCSICLQRVLTFKSSTLCDEFFKNFRDLIEIAKPLL